MLIALSLLLAAGPAPIAPVSAPLRARFALSPHYTKALDAGGLPILGSAAVADAALREAKNIVTSMLAKHPEYLKTMGEANVRLAVMAPSELTTDIPEHSDLTPKDYWDRRARGLGATAARPAVSCAEENLLEEPGDPYAAENICVHEFAHAVHEMALRTLLPDFDRKLQAAYADAQQKGTWKNTYAMTNEREYWAEAVQSWFDTNRHDDAEHGPIDTREEVQAADPAISALIVEALGNVEWRYRKPSQRTQAQRAELGAFPTPLPTFAWPARLKKPAKAFLDVAASTVALSPMVEPLPRSPSTNETATVVVENWGRVPLQWDWVGFDGALKHYATVAPGATFTQSTYVGHVWVVSTGAAQLGWFAAPNGTATLRVP